MGQPLRLHPIPAANPEPGDAGRSAPSVSAALPEICRPAQLAEYLGLSERSVYEYIRRRELPGVRLLGRSILIHTPTVLRWLADGQGGVSRSRRSKS